MTFMPDGLLQKLQISPTAISVVLLMVAEAVLLLFFTMRNSAREALELEQEINWSLAETVAGRLQPLLSSQEVDHWALRQEAHEMKLINPRIDIFILDSQGVVLWDLSEGAGKARERIELSPLRAFMEAKTRHGVLLGDDPRDAEGKTAFSAAPVKVKNADAWVYVSLLDAQSKARAGLSGTDNSLTSLLRSVFVILGCTFVVWIQHRRSVARKYRLDENV